MQNLFSLVQLFHFTHASITYMPKEKLCSELCYWLKYSTETLVWKDAVNMAHRCLWTIFQRLKHMLPNTLYLSVALAFTQTEIYNLKKLKVKTFLPSYTKSWTAHLHCIYTFLNHLSQFFWITLKYIPISDSSGWRLWMWLCKKEEVIKAFSQNGHYKEKKTVKKILVISCW